MSQQILEMDNYCLRSLGIHDNHKREPHLLQVKRLLLYVIDKYQNSILMEFILVQTLHSSHHHLRTVA